MTVVDKLSENAAATQTYVPSHHDIGDEIVEEAVKEAQNEPKGIDLDSCKVDLSIDYPEPKFALSREGIGTIPQGDIQAIKAKSKNGKTFLCSILMASAFGCDKFSFTSLMVKPLVMYFDTEQNERNTAKVIKRVHALIGWDTSTSRDDLQAFSLRKFSDEERLAAIQEAINTRRPTLAIVDGIADLITDFNDVEQSNEVINVMMKLSAENDCAIVCVLHTNKAKEDNNMKGHLGTLLLQKCSDVFEVKKVGEGENVTFNVQETDCRNRSIDDFAFKLADGLPVSAETVKEDREKVKFNERLHQMREAFKGQRSLMLKDLLSILTGINAVTERSARRHVDDAVSKGILTYWREGGYYTLTEKDK